MHLSLYLKCVHILFVDIDSSGSYYGQSVSLLGQQMCVGAPLYTGLTQFQGSMFVYSNTTVGWSLQQQMIVDCTGCFLGW